MSTSERVERFKSRYLSIRPWTRHSLVLFVGGIIYIFIGLAKILNGLPEERRQALTFALDIMAIESWGVVFIALGLFSMLTSRWPAFTKTWGYAALTGFSIMWGLFHIEGILLTDASKESLSSGLLWLFVAFMWWAIGGLLDPTKETVNEDPPGVPYGSS